jgi:hypothetical protein
MPRRLHRKRDALRLLLPALDLLPGRNRRQVARIALLGIALLGRARRDGWHLDQARVPTWIAAIPPNNREWPTSRQPSRSSRLVSWSGSGNASTEAGK